jgi:hypothetical protein
VTHGNLVSDPVISGCYHRINAETLMKHAVSAKAVSTKPSRRRRPGADAPHRAFLVGHWGSPPQAADFAELRDRLGRLNVRVEFAGECLQFRRQRAHGRSLPTSGRYSVGVVKQ